MVVDDGDVNPATRHVVRPWPIPVGNSGSVSVEFVEPSSSLSSSAGAEAAPPLGARGSAARGRVLGAAAAVAGVLTLVATQVTLYAVVRTAAIVDFDGTDYRVARIPVDAFGHATPVALTTSRGVALSDYTSTVSTAAGISYGPWWLALGVALLLAAGWCLLRPRASAPAPVVAALGGVLLGSLGAAWLAARTVAGTSVPQIRFAASPGVGLWLLLAAGALALLAALASFVRVPRRRTAELSIPGVEEG